MWHCGLYTLCLHCSGQDQYVWRHYSAGSGWLHCSCLWHFIRQAQMAWYVHTSCTCTHTCMYSRFGTVALNNWTRILILLKNECLRLHIHVCTYICVCTLYSVHMYVYMHLYTVDPHLSKSIGTSLHSDKWNVYIYEATHMHVHTHSLLSSMWK